MERYQSAVAGRNHEELTHAEKLQVGAILMHPVMQKALGRTFQQLLDIAPLVLALDLTTLGGISRIVKIQGMAHGYETFINVLGSLAVIETTE